MKRNQMKNINENGNPIIFYKTTDFDMLAVVTVPNTTLARRDHPFSTNGISKKLYHRHSDTWVYEHTQTCTEV